MTKQREPSETFRPPPFDATHNVHDTHGCQPAPSEIVVAGTRQHYDLPMEKIGERFLWMVDELKREGVTGRDVAARAGLNEAEISAYAAKFRRDPTSGIGAEKIARICEAAGFSILWMLTGKGNPRDPNGTPPPEDIDESRKTLAAKLRGVYPDEVIDYMLATRIPDGAHAEQSWWADHANYLYRSWQTKTGPWAGTRTDKAKEA